MSIALPKVTINRPKQTIDLPKVKSSDLQRLTKDNVMLESLSPPRRPKKPRKKLKEIIGLTKKLKNDLQQQNEEEQRLQTEIMQYHSSTKPFLSAILDKYGLNINNKAKYAKKRKTISLDNSGQSSKAEESL
jgi:t-SNARE complex subunit (syntaxin)